MPSKVLMIQGTSSSAGKSLLVTALCRIFARRGVKVAPFKAQNMSNNAGVCADGAEIGRAQITQAIAAGIEPTAAMNPILLKPEANVRSQVVVMGKAWRTLSARNYFERKQHLWDHVTAALDGLRDEYELIIIEGAGSPAELNLKKGDIVNMAVASYANAPVLLVGDIDRGGIFPQLIGTKWLLPEDEQQLIKAFIVNKFRGDPALFYDGVTILEEKGGVPVLGVVPWVKDLAIPEEDAVALDTLVKARAAQTDLDIVVIKIPRVSNFDDFDPLQREAGVQVRWVDSAEKFGNPDAIIIPGTKSTIADLRWLHESGLVEKILAFGKQGGAVVGICGGYQMLGQIVRDPDLVEATEPELEGIGLLPVETDFVGEKATYRAAATLSADTAWLSGLSGTPITGYEIHMGRTTGANHWLTIDERSRQEVAVADGSISADGKIWGCYLHGLFANDDLRRAWLRSLGWQNETDHGMIDLEAEFDKLADAVEAALDIDLLEKIIDGQ